MKVRIGDRYIGEEEPCFIIAEAGVNHNGDIELAKRLIDIAKNAGADAVTFQTFKTERFLSRNIVVPKHVKPKDSLDDIGIPAFKVASCDLDNLPLLKYIAKKDKTIILSTGMGTISEVGEAVEVIRSIGNGDIILLHCISVYPPKVEDVNLRAINTLWDAFKLPIGYSISPKYFDFIVGKKAKRDMKYDDLIINKYGSLLGGIL